MKIFHKIPWHRMMAVFLCCVMTALVCIAPVSSAGAATEASRETEKTQPVIKLPSVTEEPDEAIPKGEEHSDQHLDDVDYLLKYADREKIGGGDALLPVDIVYLTLTMADWSHFGHDMTLNELWTADEDKDGYPDHADAFMGQEASCAVLYAPSTDADYYAAKADLASSEDMWVTDWGAAISRNGLGEDCEGVIYDKETGIVYIPSHFCEIPEKGMEGMGMVRFQLLYAVRHDDIMGIDTSVKVNVEGDMGAASREVEAPALLPSTTVTLSEGAEVESVAVNGRLLDTGSYEYDNDTGNLTVYQSAAAIGSLDVVMSGEASNRPMTISTGPAKSLDQALADAGGRWNLPGTWQFSRNPGINESFTLNGCTTYYFDNGYGFDEVGESADVNPAIDIYASDDQVREGVPGTYTKAESFDEKLGEDILNNTWGMGDYNGRHWDGLADAGSHFFQNAMTRGAKIPGGTITSGGVNITIPATFNANMMCSHVEMGLDNGTPNDSDQHKNYNAQVFIRILGTNSANNKALVAIGCGTVREQSGVGLYIMNYQLAGGKVKVEKTAQGGFSLSGAYYNINGAEYGIYKDPGCTQPLTGFGTVIVNGASSLDPTKPEGIASAVWDMVPAGLFYVRETKSPTGFYVDAAVHKVTVTAGGTATVRSVEGPHLGSVELNKVSSNPELTDGNSLYSLKGAEYQLYRSDNTKVGSSKFTDDKGHIRWDNLELGSYYVKEINPSPGFRADVVKHDFTINNSNYTVPVKVTSSEPPVYDPAGIEISKMWNGKILPSTPSLPTLEGTRFTVRYYAGDYGSQSSLPSKASRTWVLEVKKKVINDQLKYIALLDNEYLVKSESDEFFTDANGRPALPLGTYTIQETTPAPGYTLEGKFNAKDGTFSPKEVYLTHVKDENGAVKLAGGNEYSSEDDTEPISITVIKKDGKGKPLRGVKFQLADGKGSAPITKTTDANGYVEFTDLKPETYTITEVETVDGQTLLEEPIVIKAPLRLTPQQVEEYHIDKKKVKYAEKENAYYVYDFTYEVTNNTVFNMPKAGGTVTLKRFLPLAAGMMALAVLAWFGYPLVSGRRNRNRRS